MRSLFFLAALLLSLSAAAVTIPATPFWNVNTLGVNQSFLNMPAACDKWADVYSTSRAENPATVTICRMSENGVDVYVQYRDKNGSLRGEFLGPQKYYYCPNGGTLSGTNCINVPPCPEGQERQPDGTCKDGCESKKGQEAAKGSWLQGNTPTAPFDNTACNAGCAVNFSGDVPGATQLVGGKMTYYAVGTFDYNGFACSAGEGGIPAQTPVPAPSCGTGQVMGQINGKTVCVNNGTGQVDNPHSPEKTEEKTKTPPVQNPDGSTTETETTTKADGSTTVITTTTNPDGSSTTTTTTTPGTGSSTSSGGGNGNGNGSEGSEQVDICKTNPNIPACKDITSGDAVGTDGLYEPDPDRKTFETIMEGFVNKVQQMGWYQSVSGFFNVQTPGGSCGGMSGSVGFGGYSFEYDLDPIFCGSAATTMYSILSIGVQLAATWIAFTIAFL